MDTLEIINLSKEDLERNKFYEMNKKRKMKKCIFFLWRFLKSLDMHRAEIDFIGSIYTDRIAQLTNKTNQFNLTTKDILCLILKYFKRFQ